MHVYVLCHETNHSLTKNAKCEYSDALERKINGRKIKLLNTYAENGILERVKMHAICMVYLQYEFIYR